MSIEILVRALAVFIFHNRGINDVTPVAIFLIAVWVTLAAAYLLIVEHQPPKFFGVPARRARWTYIRYQASVSDYVLRVLPWKWRPH